MVNSAHQLGRELGTCRRNFTTTLLNHLQRHEGAALEAWERDLECARRAATLKGGPSATFHPNTDALVAAQKHYLAQRRELRDETMLLVVDEADRLRIASLEQLRAIFDQGGMGLVLIGMPGLEKRLARYAQLYSRVGFVHEFRALAEPEARDLLRHGWQPPGVTLPDEAMSDDQALAVILRITDGNFQVAEPAADADRSRLDHQ